MKIDINKIDFENFRADPHMIAGEICWLVQPKSIAAKWGKETLIYRSSVWNSSGEPVSLSFCKFFNFEEQPDLAYKPFSLTANGGCNLIEKIDGSTLIVSKYKGQKIYRTRGTVDATKIDNGYEIEYLKQKYPSLDRLYSDVDTGSVSYIFEWVSPVNKIVLNYGDEPDLYLIAAINHADYTMWPQKTLDGLSKELGIKRPRTFNFASVKEMLEAIDVLKGQEGLCVYCNKDQDIRKVKSSQYLAAHRLKSELGSFERVVDYWFALDCLSYQDTEKHFSETFDFEIFSLCRGDISRICEAYKEVQNIERYMTEYANNLKNTSRKEAAQKIINSHGQTNRASMVFKLLDGRPLDKEDKKKLLYQVLKK